MLRRKLQHKMWMLGTINPEPQQYKRRKIKQLLASKKSFYVRIGWKRFFAATVLSLLLADLPHISPIEETPSISIRFYPVPRPHLKHPGILDNKAYRTAFFYFNKYLPRVRNRRYLTVIDYTRPSYVKRMAIIDLQTYTIEKHLVAHGKNSGSTYVTDFSNVVNSFESCRGVFVTGDVYYGSHGMSLPLLGLERGVNDNALERGIVIHGADYVSRRSILLNGGMLGRSWGCPAVPLNEVEHIIDKIKNGSLLYIFGN